MTAPASFVGTAPWLGQPGTFAPTKPTSSTRRFIAATLLAGSTVFGTVACVTPADAEALQAAASTTRTLPAAPPQTPTSRDTRSIPNLLRRLRDRAELNWGDIAKSMGVSRRTIHNWLTEEPVAAHHLSRLLELEMLVEINGAGDPFMTKLHLNMPGPQGRSALEDFALRSRPVRNVPLSTVSAADLLEPDTVQMASFELASVPPRRSSLQGGPLPRRRPQAT